MQSAHFVFLLHFLIDLKNKVWYEDFCVCTCSNRYNCVKEGTLIH